MPLTPLHRDSTRPPEGTPGPGPTDFVRALVARWHNCVARIKSGKYTPTLQRSRIASGLLLLLLLTPQAHAFDLDQLSAQLAKPAVVRGPLIQEKHLRALPQPLTSRGQFVLSRDLGLLWQLQSPLQQDYRIDGQGIAKRTPSGWQQQPGQDVAAQQSRLFLAVLKGDHSGLAKDFQLQLSGSAEAWQLHLTPRSPLLKQIFDSIQIEGSTLVQRIELHETQGDRSVMRMTESQVDATLSEQEQRDFAQ
jgi:hypothetical protein